jgi:type I restriction enzyme M protein
VFVATTKKIEKNAGSSTPLVVKRDGKGKIFSHDRQKWLVETPEERVRQEYLCVITNEYGYSIDQIGEEKPVTERGSGNARADFLIWRSAADKSEKKKPLIVIECKADNVQIDAATYAQGANYAQYCQALFFVTHNNRETKYWRVDHTKMMPNFDEIENIPHADANAKEIQELISKLRVFKEEEFADLLQKCHDVIRNRESHDPTKAFDETAKILFVKVWVERELKAKKQRKNIFSVDFLDNQMGDDPVNDLFYKTKKHYEKDALFGKDDKISLRPETSREIVRLLERYNLSDTSEDIKGIAFERFLGRTFRGEIGQFFTPRPIVEFMIRMLDPQEGEVICDPASGSGGFLIRSFEILRHKILLSVDEEYKKFEKNLIDQVNLSDQERARQLLLKYEELQAQLDQKTPGTRMWNLSNRSIYGTDKNDRMARTSKMNMIMHGDGHGGVHHWNGFLNVNGIFEGRFDLILTNPPFGSKLENDEKVLANDIELPEDLEEHYESVYGEQYRLSRATLKAAVNKPIASLFELPGEGDSGSIKTEILFIERCLDLLRPGGRMGIVLPEGVFNNPSVARVRHFVEDRAQLYAVVSLPAATFVASGATVKTSLLFLRKFTEEQKANYDELKTQTLLEARATYIEEINVCIKLLETSNAKQSDYLLVEDKSKPEAKAKASFDAKEFNERLKELKKSATKKLKEIESRIELDARTALRKLTRYPIFMYEAEYVGLTATGAEDDNELFPNNRTPKEVSITALEQFHNFLVDAKPFLDKAHAEEVTS